MLKIWLIDQQSYCLGTLDLSPLWPEEAQRMADECGDVLTAVVGNDAGTFQPAQSVNEPAEEERP